MRQRRAPARTGRDYKTRTRRPDGGFSGWSGLGVGLAVGLAAAVAIYIRDHRPAAPAPAGTVAVAPAQAPKGGRHRAHADDAQDASSADAAGTAAAATAVPPGKPYDFYRILSTSEVAVPDRTKDVHPDIRLAPETRRGTYVVQAGTYKVPGDAERRRAQLAALGIEAKIQKVSVDSDSWQRISIGPLSNLDELNRLREKLRKANIDVLVIRVDE